MMHTLYRFYGADDTLLYVGLTCNPGQRFLDHRSTKEWWLEIERIHLEQHPDRLTLIAAERTAIKTEHPLYNIAMNGPRRELVAQPRVGDPTWTFYSRRYGDQRTGVRAQLVYEVNGSAMSDDYYVDEASAEELLYAWWRRYMPAEEIYDLPDSLAPIFWYVEFDKSPNFEGAPFCAMAAKLADEHDHAPCNFLDYFTWPISEQTGQPLNWLELAVQDKTWNETRADKGGFLQEALGWKPSAFQATVDIAQLATLAGIRLRAHA